jgi:hypothetical protein
MSLRLYAIGLLLLPLACASGDDGEAADGSTPDTTVDTGQPETSRFDQNPLDQTPPDNHVPDSTIDSPLDVIPPTDGGMDVVHDTGPPPDAPCNGYGSPCNVDLGNCNFLAFEVCIQVLFDAGLADANNGVCLGAFDPPCDGGAGECAPGSTCFTAGSLCTTAAERACVCNDPMNAAVCGDP